MGEERVIEVQWEEQPGGPSGHPRMVPKHVDLKALTYEQVEDRGGTVLIRVRGERVALDALQASVAAEAEAR